MLNNDIFFAKTDIDTAEDEPRKGSKKGADRKFTAGDTCSPLVARLYGRINRSSTCPSNQARAYSKVCGARAEDPREDQIPRAHLR